MLTGLCAWRGPGRPFPYSFYMLQVEMGGGVREILCTSQWRKNFDRRLRSVIPGDRKPPYSKGFGPYHDVGYITKLQPRGGLPRTSRCRALVLQRTSVPSTTMSRTSGIGTARALNRRVSASVSRASMFCNASSLGAAPETLSPRSSVKHGPLQTSVECN